MKLIFYGACKFAYCDNYCHYQSLELSMSISVTVHHRTKLCTLCTTKQHLWHLSLSHALSLSYCISPLALLLSIFLQSDLSRIHHCHWGGASLRDRKASWETVSQTLHDKVSASQDLTPIKTTHPTRDFPFTKALVLGIQGSPCQQRHPKYQWKLSCCGIQHSKHQKQGNYCWHKPPLCHKRPLSIRAVSVTENNKRNAWINQPWVELIWISKSNLIGRIDLKNYTDLCWMIG